MLLNEFFGRSDNKLSDKNKESNQYNNDLFEFILDHDNLYKEYAFPILRKIKHLHEKNKLDKKECMKEFIPMINKACMEYYKKNQIKGHLESVFPKQFKKGMCEKLYDHYYENVIKDQYKLGD